jgi:hypothetical protein
MTSLIIACLVGLYFGLYFNFLVLIPLTLAAILASSFASVWYGQTISAALVAIVLLAVGIQGGYMIGLSSRELFSQFLSRLRAVPSKGV